MTEGINFVAAGERKLTVCATFAMRSSSLDLQYGLIDCANGVSDAVRLINRDPN